MKEIDEYYKNNKEQMSSESSGEEAPQSEYYCELCDKSFKTTNQMENHKNSKIHKQNMKIVFKEVALDEDKAALINLEVQKTATTVEQRPSKKKKKNRKKNKEQNGAAGDQSDD
jgi:DnaJ family protein A protein 5